MKKFLGTARTVDEVLEMVKPYRGSSIILHGCEYKKRSVNIYYDEEEKSIEILYSTCLLPYEITIVE